MPDFTSLCTIDLDAVTADGKVIARNFAHFLVSADYPADHDDEDGRLILRRRPHEWAAAEWSGPMRTRPRAQTADECFGHGHGYFEWNFDVQGVPFDRLQRLEVLCELSARRGDFPQTDDDLFQTSVEVQLNGVTVHQATLSNHPHDSRGVLSYLRGARGAYGYLTSSTVERHLMERIISNLDGGVIRLRCSVPEGVSPEGGLTVYGAESGRYPICPTLMFEW